MSAGPSCPLCRSGAAKTFVRERAGYTLWDCPDCGAGFCDPFKNPGPEYYEHNQDMYSVKLESTTDPMSFEYDEALDLLTRTLTPGARLLDVGCGAGGFLHRARAAGFAVSGVDFNSERAKALNASGFEVFHGSLPAFGRASAATYDAMTMFEIVEHLDDLAVWLDAAKSLLKPGGLLIVGTPNRERSFDPFVGPGLEEVDNPPHHLTRWSASALNRALSRACFEVSDCRALAYPLPLVRLMVRNSLRFGLATKALGVEQLRHSPAADAAVPPSGAGAVRGLVAIKEAVLNAGAWLTYPLFRAACALFGWEGPILFAAARKPSR
jgi:SAM-dependent methyltransferase